MRWYPVADAGLPDIYGMLHEAGVTSRACPMCGTVHLVHPSGAETVLRRIGSDQEFRTIYRYLRRWLYRVAATHQLSTGEIAAASWESPLADEGHKWLISPFTMADAPV